MKTVAKCRCFVVDCIVECCGDCCGTEAVMLSQPVWDQMLESEKKKVQVLEESYAEKMRAASVSLCCDRKTLVCVAEVSK